MRAWGVTTLRLIDLLETIGPMTRSEMCVHLGVGRQNVSSVVTRLMRPSLRPPGPKRVYICGWQDDHDGQRDYLRAISTHLATSQTSAGHVPSNDRRQRSAGTGTGPRVVQ